MDTKDLKWASSDEKISYYLSCRNGKVFITKPQSVEFVLMNYSIRNQQKRRLTKRAPDGAIAQKFGNAICKVWRNNV